MPGVQRKVTSSYRRDFSPKRSVKEPIARQCISAYSDYRENRRKVEHSHENSPFVWDDWTYESDSIVDLRTSRTGSTESDEGFPPPSPKPDARKKSPSSVGSSGRISRKSQRSQESDETSASSISVEPPSSVHKHSTKHIGSGTCNCGVSPGRPTPKGPRQPEDKRRSVNYQTDWNRRVGVSERVLSDTISKSRKNTKKTPPRNHRTPYNSQIDESPFVQYGIGDDEVETGNKRTYNIQCHDQVYSTAHLGKARQEAQRAMTRERLNHIARDPSCRRHKTISFDPRFDERMNKKTSNWMSEYDKKFLQYRPEIYIRNRVHQPPYP